MRDTGKCAAAIVLFALASVVSPAAVHADASALARLGEEFPRPLSLAQARRLAPQLMAALDDEEVSALRAGCESVSCDHARLLVGELLDVAHRHRARDLRRVIEERLVPTGEDPVSVVAYFAFALGNPGGPVVATLNPADVVPHGAMRRPPVVGRYWRIEPYEEEERMVTVRLYGDTQGSQRTSYRMDYRFGRWWVSAVRSLWLRGHDISSRRGDPWASRAFEMHSRCRLRSWDATNDGHDLGPG